MKEEPNTANAPIAIGTPVKPSIAVRAMELSGAVATTVKIPPRMIPMMIGLAFADESNTSPIFNKVPSTTGCIQVAIKRASGAPIMMIAIRSRPAGTFFSRNLTT